MQRLAGVGLIIGSVLFFIAAFTPLTFRVIMADTQQRIELIQKLRVRFPIYDEKTGPIFNVLNDPREDHAFRFSTACRSDDLGVRCSKDLLHELTVVF